MNSSFEDLQVAFSLPEEGITQSLGRGLVDAQPVDHQCDRAADLPQQPVNEQLKVFGGEIVFEEFEYKLEPTLSRRNRSRGRRSEPIVAIVAREYGRLAAWSPGAAQPWTGA